MSACIYFPMQECERGVYARCLSCYQEEVEEKEKLYCVECGRTFKELEDFYNINGDFYCEDCLNEVFKVEGGIL